MPLSLLECFDDIKDEKRAFSPIASGIYVLNILSPTRLSRSKEPPSPHATSKIAKADLNFYHESPTCPFPFSFHFLKTLRSAVAVLLLDA